MAITQVFPRTTNSGQHADFPARRGFTPPAGKFNVTTPAANFPNQAYLDAGVTQVVLGSGGSVTDAGLTEQQRGVFIENPHWLKDANSGSYLNTWDEAKCDHAVDTWFAARGGNVKMMLVASEAYDDSYNWRNEWEYAPQQYSWLDRRWKFWMDKIGGSQLGDYAGSLSVYSATGNLIDPGAMAALITGLSSYNNALNFVKSAEGNRWPYFKTGNWRYRDTCHKTYYVPHLSTLDNLYSQMIGFQLHNMCMMSDEVNGAGRAWRLGGVYMPEGSEFMGYSEYHTIPVAGGTLTGHHFPSYMYGFHVARAFTHWVWCAIQWGWADGKHWGMDPSVLEPFWENYVYSGTGAGVRIVRAGYGFQPGGAGINPQAIGYNNGDQEGMEWFAIAAAWTGSVNATFCKFRQAGGSYVSMGNDYLVRRSQEKAGFAYLFQGPGSKQAVFAFMPGAGQWKTWQFDTGMGSPKEAYLCGHTPYLLLID